MSSRQVKRGELVLVDVPYLDASQAVRRPALVICDTSQVLDVIIAGITSRIRDPLPATHLPILQSHVDWKISGLRLESAVRCGRIFTVEHTDIHRVLGLLSPATMLEIELRLKRALGIA